MFGVNGLLYIPNYISQEHHDFLVETINKNEWRNDLSRRTQHYGYIYDYKARSVTKESYIGKLPHWIDRINFHLQADGLIDLLCDQAIVNEYEPGQGIGDHVDCEPCFGDIIISLSLLSPVVINLKRDKVCVQIVLEPRSVLVLGGVARFGWTHGIAKKKHDEINGEIVQRQRRLSLTFRKVVSND